MLKADLCRYAAEEACANTRQGLAARCQATYQLAWVRVPAHCNHLVALSVYAQLSTRWFKHQQVLFA
jgi:hypothetical protein